MGGITWRQRGASESCPCLKGIGQGAAWVFADGGEMPHPVSYTHLDVYKRQQLTAIVMPCGQVQVVTEVGNHLLELAERNAELAFDQTIFQVFDFSAVQAAVCEQRSGNDTGLGFA